MSEFLITEKGKKAKDTVKSPDSRAILEYMVEHTKANTDEVKLMLGVINSGEELASLERAGFVKKVEEGKW